MIRSMYVEAAEVIRREYEVVSDPEVPTAGAVALESVVIGLSRVFATHDAAFDARAFQLAAVGRPLDPAEAALTRVRALVGPGGEYEPCSRDPKVCEHAECDTGRAVLAALEGDQPGD